jgi:hypothetical protein
MPSATASGSPNSETRSQPWMAYWPPKTAKTPGDTHGFGKGELMLQGGSGGRSAEWDRHPLNARILGKT